MFECFGAMFVVKGQIKRNSMNVNYQSKNSRFHYAFLLLLLFKKIQKHILVFNIKKNAFLSVNYCIILLCD